MGSPLEDEISPFSVFSSPLLLPRGLVVGGDQVADLVADPAPALMGGDQRALMAPDPSAHQGVSAVLLLATTAPPRSALTAASLAGVVVAVEEAEAELSINFDFFIFMEQKCAVLPPISSISIGLKIQ